MKHLPHVEANPQLHAAPFPCSPPYSLQGSVSRGPERSGGHATEAILRGAETIAEPFPARRSTAGSLYHNGVPRAQGYPYPYTSVIYKTYP